MAYLECNNIISESWYDSNITLEINKYRIATLWLNREDKHNALNEQMVSGLNSAFDFLENYLSENSVNIKVLVLRSKGKSFCAGADLKSMQQMVNYDYEQNYNDALSLARVLERLSNFSCPTIAVVQGSAFGGGVGLICACDFALGYKQAQFCLSEVKLGIIPAVISPYIYSALGSKAAMRAILSADIIDSTQALDCNLLSKVVTNIDSLELELELLLSKLMPNGPLAMQQAKKLIKQYDNEGLNINSNAQTAELIAKIRVSDEGQEGLKSFVEKRKPSWILHD